MEILHFEDLGDIRVISECSLGVNLVIAISLRYFTSVYNLKAIGPLPMEILHFEDLGDTSVISECSLGGNLVIDIFCM